MTYLFPTLVSIPTLLMWLSLFLRLSGITLSGIDPGWGLATVGLSFLAFCSCIAMAILKPEAKEWRVAAIFNAVPFILVVPLSLLPLG